MKILFLNVWHGKVAEPLRSFLREQSDTDVVCFQEFTDEATEIVRSVFPEHCVFSSEKHAGYKADFSVATLIHQRCTIVDSAELLQSDDEIGAAIGVEIEDVSGRRMTLLNVHGTARKYENGQFLDTDAKLDFPARLRQTEELLGYLSGKRGARIVGGDFNMLPEASSIRAFEKFGYRDLIREYAIPTTRNHLSWDLYPNTPYLFSDYVFLSPEIGVKSFSVPNVEVSDHLPMILETENL